MVKEVMSWGIIISVVVLVGWAILSVLTALANVVLGHFGIKEINLIVTASIMAIMAILRWIYC